MSAKHGLNIIEVRRKISAKNQFFKTINQEIAGSNTVIEEEDILYIHGPFESVQAFALESSLEMMDRRVPENKQAAGSEQYATEDVGIAEVMLTPTSRLINRLIKESGFREKYRVNILGIQRKDHYLLHNLKEEKIRFGDAMLVQELGAILPGSRPSRTSWLSASRARKRVRLRWTTKRRLPRVLWD